MAASRAYELSHISLSFTLAEKYGSLWRNLRKRFTAYDLIRNQPEPIAAQRIAISERPALNSRYPLSSAAHRGFYHLLCQIVVPALSVF